VEEGKIMGVCHYNCARCDHSFPDCSDYCCFCVECGSRFCCLECADVEPTDEENINRYELEECCICRKEVATDYILLEVLLRKYKITRDDVLEMWQEEKEEDNGK
jgi:hypothetical protein